MKGSLRRTLCSTNPIQNPQGLLKRVVRNVKRWRAGMMALRWTVTGLMHAQRRFKRIRGHRDLDALLAALDAKIKLRKAA